MDVDQRVVKMVGKSREDEAGGYLTGAAVPKVGVGVLVIDEGRVLLGESPVACAWALGVRLKVVRP